MEKSLLQREQPVPQSPYVVSRLRSVGSASNMVLNERMRRMIANGETVYHFAFGQSPFPVVDGARQTLSDHAGENDYLPVAGLPELRVNICKFHDKLDGLTGLDPRMVVVGPGSKQLMFLLVQIFNGDVILLSPTWVTYKAMTTLAGKHMVKVETSMKEEWKLTPESLEQAILENGVHVNYLLIFCNPDNPTGTSYTEDDLKALSNVLRKYNVVVLSDEIYAHTKYEGDFVSLAKYYPEGTILSSGISKCFGAGGWRCGYNIYPKELVSIYNAVCSASSNTHSCVAAPIQYAAIHLFKLDGETIEVLKGTRIIMGALAQYCHRELTSVGIKAMMPSAGFYIFPDFEILRLILNTNGIHTCQQMCDKLFSDRSVALMPGGPGFLRPIDEFTVRLCFVNFEGGAALHGWKQQGGKDVLDGRFLSEFCSPVLQGIQAIVSWVNELLVNNPTTST